MGNAYYFFSDVHLGLESEDKEKLKETKLIEFLNEIQSDAREIFIVGDLFDCWIEYKQTVPKGFYRLFTKISEISESGIKINYIAGNHDFWKGDYFRKEFGIDICHTHIEREIEVHYARREERKDYKKYTAREDKKDFKKDFKKQIYTEIIFIDTSGYRHKSCKRNFLNIQKAYRGKRLFLIRRNEGKRF
jgi:DNA repair exonuclease SbcCD nuclease subunit